MKVTTKVLKSGRALTSAYLENGNQITFNSTGMSEENILAYAKEKLDYEPVDKINLTAIISQAERLALC